MSTESIMVETHFGWAGQEAGGLGLELGEPTPTVSEDEDVMTLAPRVRHIYAQ